MSRTFLTVVAVCMYLVMGVFVEHNFKVIEHVQICCPYLRANKCCDKEKGCCESDKGCCGKSCSKCDCDECDCCKKCPGQK